MSEITEIRWHGRGGQGVVTAGELLAEAAMEEGKYFQAFPDYGPERMGAPVKSFTRISETPLDIRCQIQEPDVVMVLDPTVVGVVDVTEGLKPDGVILINTSEAPSQVRKRLKLSSGRLVTVDATRISLDTIGRNIPNTPMLGALIKVSKLVNKDSVIALIEHRFGAKFPRSVVEGNIQAVNRAFDEAQVD
jgi:pyruvate ferredoxin oxidoreductase gamma subunit